MIESYILKCYNDDSNTIIYVYHFTIELIKQLDRDVCSPIFCDNTQSVVEKHFLLRCLLPN